MTNAELTTLHVYYIHKRDSGLNLPPKSFALVFNAIADFSALQRGIDDGTIDHVYIIGPGFVHGWRMYTKRTVLFHELPLDASREARLHAEHARGRITGAGDWDYGRRMRNREENYEDQIRSILGDVNSDGRITGHDWRLLRAILEAGYTITKGQ